MLSPDVRPGDPSGAWQRHAAHQVVNAFVHIAQALFQPNHGLAIRGEPEMARLDDPRVHRAHRDLVQALTFHRQERVGSRVWAMIQPRTRIGQSNRLDPEQIA